MAINREEIKWKLELLLESISATQEVHENESKTIQEKWDKIFSNIINARNTFVGGIGFGIGLWVALISINVIGKETSVYILIPLIIGITIFAGINFYVNKIEGKIINLGSKYREQLYYLLKLKGWVLGYAMREDVTTDQIILIIQFLEIITQTMSYEIKIHAHDNFKTIEPNQDEFRSFYDRAKNLSNFKSIGLPDFPNIDSFIKLFELHETKF